MISIFKRLKPDWLFFCFCFLIIPCSLSAQSMVRPSYSELEKLFIKAADFARKKDSISAVREIEKSEKVYLKRYNALTDTCEWLAKKAEFYAFYFHNMESACDTQMEVCSRLIDSKKYQDLNVALRGMVNYSLLLGEYEIAYGYSLLQVVNAEFHKENRSSLTDAFFNYAKTCLLMGKYKEALSASMRLKKLAWTDVRKYVKKEYWSFSFFPYQEAIEMVMRCNLALGYVEEAQHEMESLDSLAHVYNAHLKEHEKYKEGTYASLAQLDLLIRQKKYEEALRVSQMHRSYLWLPFNMENLLEEVQFHMLLAELHKQRNCVGQSAEELLTALELLTKYNRHHPLLAEILSLVADRLYTDDFYTAMFMLSRGKKILNRCGLGRSLQMSNLLQQQLEYGLEKKETQKYWYRWIMYATVMKFESLRKEFAVCDPNERAYVWNKPEYKNWFEHILPEIVTDASLPYNDTILSLAYSGVQNTKGVLLSSDIRIRKRIQTSKNEQLLKDYNELVDQKKRMFAFWRDGNIVEMDKIQKKIYMQNNRLLQNMDFIHDEDFCNEIGVNTLYVKKIKEGDVYIDFMKYKTRQNKYCYGAFVVGKYEGESGAVAIKLCDAEAVDSLNTDSIYYSDHLYNLVWKFMIDRLPNIKAKRIFFSAAGNLHNMPIEYVPDSEGKSVNDKFEVHRVLSTREAILNNVCEEKQVYKKISLWGNMDFNNFQSYFDHYAPPALPGTKIEIESVCQQIPGNIKYEVMEQKKATEKAFKQHDFSRTDVLHIATHAYYLTDQSRFKPKGWNWGSSSAKWSKKGMLPFEDRNLMHSFLLLTKENGKEGEDGILSAAEISMMNLSHLDLVVLSACRTGLGKPSSEGNVGLQRAFKKAGVKSILLSLKTVYDRPTSLLMSAFYRELLAGKTKRQALIAAQKSLQSYARGLYADPKYWAPFILIDAYN